MNQTGHSIRKALMHFVKERISLKGVYDTWVSPEDAACPFMSVGTGYDRAEYLKTGVHGTYSLTLDMWHDLPAEEQDKIVTLMGEVIHIAQNLALAGADIRLTKSDCYYTYDTSGSTPYLHGVLSLTFIY